MRPRLLLGALAGAAALFAAGPSSAAGIQWAKSFQDAMTQAKASNKLVMADFYADW